ncbi:MAG: T9SS type A sorting domain-containing protein [Bacteroidota bacterium]
MKKHLTFTFLFLSSLIVAQSISGDLEDYMGNLIDNAPGSSGDDYVIPNTNQLNTWNTVIDYILVNNLVDARSNASSINYQVTEFTDTSINPNQVFYILEEKSSQSYYWGTYIFSKTPIRNNLVIMAPHSKYDTNTGKEAVYSLKNTVAKAAFINGTHRCNSDNYSSCSGTTSACGYTDDYKMSDLAHTTTSMFQKTTENLFNNISNSVFIQLHGFSKTSSDPYVIMSNGTRETPTIDYAELIKDALLEEDNTLTFKLAHKDQSWTRLIGFTNTQGRLINDSPDHCYTSATSTSGRFIHIEQEKSKLRNDETGWKKMSNALAKVFSSTLSTHVFHLDNLISIRPNPTTGKFFISGENITSIEIFNLLGQKISSQKNNNKNLIILDLNNHVRGVYYLKIIKDRNIISKKIIKN